MTVFAFIGFGELGSALAAGLRAAGGSELRAYVRPPREARTAAARDERLAAAGVVGAPSARAAARGADAVLAVVPARATLEAAQACAPALEPGALYVDMAAAAPSIKVAAAELIDRAGGRYVDVAVLGTVAVNGAAVPMLASGAGASRWRELAEPLGLDVRSVKAPAGHASRVKLLRSVYLKGRDALVMEMVLAARRHGLQDAVVQSIGGPGEQVTFEALVDRIVCAVAVHAGRRAEELARSAELLEEVGVEPIVARAATARLRWLGELGLRDAFEGQRPRSQGEVLAAIEARSAR